METKIAIGRSGDNDMVVVNKKHEWRYLFRRGLAQNLFTVT
jgi:hypothetical protein